MPTIKEQLDKRSFIVTALNTETGSSVVYTNLDQDSALGVYKNLAGVEKYSFITLSKELQVKVKMEVIYSID